MPRYIVRWDVGWGESFDTVEADTEDNAQMAAYALAKEEFESNADYSVVGEATPELLEEHGLS
jgi:hypothetical protein